MRKQKEEAAGGRGKQRQPKREEAAGGRGKQRQPKRETPK